MTGLLVVLKAFAHLQSQPTDVVETALRTEKGCRDCRIVARFIARIGAPGDPVLVTPASRAVRLSSGSYIVAPLSSGSDVAIYAANGRFKRSVGRAGSGPGEWSRSLGPLIGGLRGGALLVDRGNGRAIVIDSLGGMRPLLVPPAEYFSGLVLSGDRIVVNAVFRDPRHFGSALHEVAETSRVIRSMDRLESTAPRELHDATLRTLAPARGGGFWAANTLRYRLTLWDAAGVARQILARNIAARANPDGTSNFGVASIAEDRQRRLWLAMTLRPRSNAPASQREGSISNFRRGVTSVIDVIDLSRGAVLFSQAYPHAPYMLLGDGFACRYLEDQEGNAYLEVVRLELVRGSF